MSFDRELIRAVRAEIDQARRILVISHIRPDGDAIGSLLGMGLSLQAAGKQVNMMLSDGLPAGFKHLPGSDQICEQPQGEFDLVIVVDCSDLPRAGSYLEGRPAPGINIDHHVTNLEFAVHNLVDVQAAATAEILAVLLPELGLPLTGPVVAALLTGILTDTIGFRTSNVTSNTLRIAASLVDQGADLAELYRHALNRRSITAIQYWGRGLTKIEYNGRIIWTTLTLEDRKAVKYPGRDDADLINLVSAIEDFDIALVFVEQPDERVKVSWRLTGQAPDYMDVAQVALRFGGGGHRAASGADMAGNLEQVKEKVLSVTKEMCLVG